MKRTSIVAVAALTSTFALTACSEEGTNSSPTPSSSVTTSPPPDVSAHESGPDSPISYGLEVPEGATQLGPLMRVRSNELIEAYRPELEAAEKEREEAQLEEAEEDAEPGETPTTPTPTPDDPPSDDTFRILDEQPRPDTVVSLMRVDGNPGDVTRRMLAQIAALLPDEEVPTNDLASICETSNDRVTQCVFDIEGTTDEDRTVRVRMAVDPGNVKTRTSPPSSLRNPVMTLQVQYAGDPVEGQASRESNDLDDVEDIDDTPDGSGLIWPRMDIDAEASTKLVNQWTAPASSTILLSGFDPKFVVLNVERATAGDAMARDWATDRIEGEVNKDVVEDLNEVSTTYSGRGEDGAFYRSTHVLSARGNYVTLVVYADGVAP